MERPCMECGTLFSGPNRINARKFCSEACRARSSYRARAMRDGHYTGVVFPPKLAGCRYCGGTLSGRGASARYCSDKCRHSSRYARYLAHKHDNRVPFTCAFVYCDATTISVRGSKYCSKQCKTAAQEQQKHGDGAAQTNAIRRGLLVATRVYFWPCIDCCAVTCSKTRTKRQVLCKTCRQERNRRRYHLKNNRRRGSQPDKPLSVRDIAKRDGTRCHICHRKVDMNLSGRAKWGPTVEHIVCVSWDAEAARDTSQHVLAHRFCNVSRNNKKPSQMVLALGA